MGGRWGGKRGRGACQHAASKREARERAATYAVLLSSRRRKRAHAGTDPAATATSSSASEWIGTSPGDSSTINTPKQLERKKTRHRRTRRITVNQHHRHTLYGSKAACPEARVGGAGRARGGCGMRSGGTPSALACSERSALACLRRPASSRSGARTRNLDTRPWATVDTTQKICHGRGVRWERAEVLVMLARCISAYDGAGDRKQRGKPELLRKTVVQNGRKQHRKWRVEELSVDSMFVSRIAPVPHLATRKQQTPQLRSSCHLLFPIRHWSDYSSSLVVRTCLPGCRRPRLPRSVAALAGLGTRTRRPPRMRCRP